MSANPGAVVLFIALILIGQGLGFDATSSAAITWMFLLYVPGWLVCSYWWDKRRKEKQRAREHQRQQQAMHA